MRYFFDVVEGRRRVRDHEGGDYTGLAAAKAEAEQTAREIAAEHLRQGRALPLTWRIEVRDSRGEVCAAVAFEAAILEKRPQVTAGDASFQHRLQPEEPARRGFLEVYRRIHILLAEAHGLNSKVQTSFEEMRKHLAGIA
jgi:uncharacterized protein DUF6894